MDAQVTDATGSEQTWTLAGMGGMGGMARGYGGAAPRVVARGDGHILGVPWP